MSINTPLQVRRAVKDRTKVVYAGVIDSHGEQIIFCNEDTAEAIVEVMNQNALLTEPNINDAPAWVAWYRNETGISLDGAMLRRGIIMNGNRDDYDIECLSSRTMSMYASSNYMAASILADREANND